MPKVRGSARKLEKSWLAVAKLGEPKPGEVICAHRVRALERRVERDLLIILVEQVLRPQFDRPALLRPAHAEAGVDHGEAVLLLLGEQVRAGIVVAGQAGVGIDEQRQAADCRARGVQVIDAVARIFGRVGQIVARQQEQGRIERRAGVAADQVVAITGADIGEARGDLEIGGADRSPPRSRRRSRSRPAGHRPPRSRRSRRG